MLTRMVAHRHTLGRRQTSSRVCAGAGATARLVVDSTIEERQTRALDPAVVDCPCTVRFHVCELCSENGQNAHISNIVSDKGYTYPVLQASVKVFCPSDEHIGVRCYC